MLRFRLHQIFVPSLARYFVPLPKLGAAQLGLFSKHLQGRGFKVRTGGAATRLSAVKTSQRISIDGSLGLASSGGDLLDALAPVVPSLLASRARTSELRRADVSPLYYSVRRSGTSAKLQLFPRLESLRTWSSLRADGLCGLTPDEAFAVKRVLVRGGFGSTVECVTGQPREGSVPLRFGRKVYYRSRLPASDFLSSLRTVESGRQGTSYLPRDSAIPLSGRKNELPLTADELGEWCLVGEKGGT